MWIDGKWSSFDRKDETKDSDIYTGAISGTRWITGCCYIYLLLNRFTSSFYKFTCCLLQHSQILIFCMQTKGNFFKMFQCQMKSMILPWMFQITVIICCKMFTFSKHLFLIISKANSIHLVYQRFPWVHPQNPFMKQTN